MISMRGAGGGARCAVSAQSALCSARRAQVLVAKVKCKTSARPLADTRSAHARTAAERGGETLIQQQRPGWGWCRGRATIGLLTGDGCRSRYPARAAPQP